MSSSTPPASPTMSHSPHDKKAVVIGLYGVPGCGKSHLLKEVKSMLGEANFTFYDGSEKIAAICPKGLDGFKRLNHADQTNYRENAIKQIQDECIESGKTAVIAGHAMFWTEGDRAAKHIWTKRDSEVYTHIIYLDIDAGTVVQRREHDEFRVRDEVSKEHIQQWQEAEKAQLRHLCSTHGILFTFMQASGPQYARELIQDFQHHSEDHNLLQAQIKVDDIIAASKGKIETVLVLDADKTLAASDASELFWRKSKSGSSPLRALFSSRWGYSYAAFRQMSLLYESAANDEEFSILCQEAASDIRLYPEIEALLQRVPAEEHIAVIVVTSGLRQVWQKVLDKADLSDTVTVIGGGRIADGMVVTADVKAGLVRHVRDVHKKYVWALGDSPLDLSMLNEAHQALVVVAAEEIRSKTMEAALSHAIDYHGLVAQQVLFPSTVAPRLDSKRLPHVQLSDPALMGSLLRRRPQHAGLEVILGTEKAAAKLLATNMRDAAIAGPALREAHHKVGAYLALEYVSDIIGLEDKKISHVLGSQVYGSQLAHEDKTTIVAIMRGGEPMAFGANSIFPQAWFVHAKGAATELRAEHIRGQHTVILVDSVINTGKSIVEFVDHIRSMHATIRIVVIAGVVQAQAVDPECPESLHRKLAHVTGVSIVGLRTSPTKFIGTGTTDTGNRLFNTTALA